MLHWTSIGNGKSREDVSSQLADGQGHHEHYLEEQPGNKELQGTNQKKGIMLHQMDPIALQALHQLVSLVHDGVSIAGHSEQLQSTLTDGTILNVKGECNKNVASSSFCLEDDPVAKVLWTLEPLQLQNVLLAMVHNFPRTLEALILHMLSPVAAEVLTRKFDEIDLQTSKEDRDEFYLAVYGIFDDQFAAMNAVLNGKESFARQAFKNVLDKYMGVNFDGQKL